MEDIWSRSNPKQSKSSLNITAPSGIHKTVEEDICFLAVYYEVDKTIEDI